MEHQSSALCAVILTALPIEYQAVRAYVANPQEEIHPEGTIYERGTFTAHDHCWEIGLVETRMGIARAAFETERAIDYFKPRLALFVGVAGGLKDVKIGDVVAATKVYGYESGKASTTFQTRPEVGNSTYRMIKRAEAEAKKNDWLRQLGSAPQPLPRALVGPIAAGEKVVTSTRSATWKFLKEHYGDALAVEMEAHGFMQAAHGNQQIEALIVRGISDLIDGKSEADAAHSQDLAAQHASAFAFEMLAKLAKDELFTSSSARMKSAKKGKRVRDTGKYNTQFLGNVQNAALGDNPHITIHNADVKKEK